MPEKIYKGGNEVYFQGTSPLPTFLAKACPTSDFHSSISVIFLPFKTSHPVSERHITFLDGFTLMNKSMLCYQQEKVVANLHYTSTLQGNSAGSLNNVRVVPSSVRFILEQVVNFNITLQKQLRSQLGLYFTHIRPILESICTPRAYTNCQCYKPPRSKLDCRLKCCSE